MKTINILIGIPGSGKSTFSSQLKNLKNIKILSTDEIRETLFGREFNQEIKDKVFDQLIKESITYLNRNLDTQDNLILDTTYLNTKSAREKFFSRLLPNLKEKMEYITVRIYTFDTPLESCIERDKMREPHRVVGRSVIETLFSELETLAGDELKHWKRRGVKIYSSSTENSMLIPNFGDRKLNSLEKEYTGIFLEHGDQVLKEYLNREISGTLFSNLILEHISFEDFYLEDLKKFNSFPLGYYENKSSPLKGIFLNTNYEKVEIGESLDSSKLIIKNIYIK